MNIANLFRDCNNIIYLPIIRNIFLIESFKLIELESLHLLTAAAFPEGSRGYSYCVGITWPHSPARPTLP